MGAGRRNERHCFGRNAAVSERAIVTGAGGYQLRGFPTVILFRSGEEVARFSGARTAQQVQEFLSQHLNAEFGMRSAEPV